MKHSYPDYKVANDGLTHLMRGTNPCGQKTRCGRITHHWKGGAQVEKTLTPSTPTCGVCAATLAQRPAWT